MPTLLCTLGSSWAVVPEAFHLLGPGPSGFSAVHVLTSDSPTTDKSASEVRNYFTSRYPNVELTIAHVADFSDLRCSADHERFEEVLLRWILLHAPNPAERYLCLAGGFKTMSSAMQRAAGFLGAAEVFHVLAAATINTPELIEQAAATGAIDFVRLGAEPGWPALAHLCSADFPLNHESHDKVSVVDHDLSNRITALTAKQHHISRNFEQLSELPFAALATLSPARLAWLNQRFKPTSAGHQTWLGALPKVELHCHLGGFATHGEALESVRAAATCPELLPKLLDRPFLAGWPTPPTPCGLAGYLPLGDNNGSRLLRDAGCLRAHCESLYAALIADGVLYAEIRCSPNNYATTSRSAWDVLNDIRTHFQLCMEGSAASRPGQTAACHVNLIIIATRKDGGDRSDISRHLALAITAAGQWSEDDRCRVVGVDLAGLEHRDTRAALFATDFEAIHRVGLAVTIHAGENDDAEGIWQAVFKLNTRRLGHALHLNQSCEQGCAGIAML